MCTCMCACVGRCEFVCRYVCPRARVPVFLNSNSKGTLTNIAYINKHPFKFTDINILNLYIFHW